MGGRGKLYLDRFTRRFSCIYLDHVRRSLFGSFFTCTTDSITVASGRRRQQPIGHGDEGKHTPYEEEVILVHPDTTRYHVSLCIYKVLGYINSIKVDRLELALWLILGEVTAYRLKLHFPYSCRHSDFNIHTKTCS